MTEQGQTHGGLPLRAIGVVRTRHTSREHTPVQSSLNPDDEGHIELNERYLDALDGLAAFSHAWLLTWLGPPAAEATVTASAEMAADPPLRQVPFLLGRQPREIGILATRGPRRINPIGLSLVRLVGIEGAVIRFAGVDLLDGTPLLDLKPFVARFDTPTGEIRGGWFDDLDLEASGDDVTPARLAAPPAS